MLGIVVVIPVTSDTLQEPHPPCAIGISRTHLQLCNLALFLSPQQLLLQLSDAGIVLVQKLCNLAGCSAAYPVS